ncbi:DNA-binding transcriptional regulator, HxlR family [Pedobacter terrae]|uniref:DNA-binding transcriptional regulator, HxlR family n=1 Tax=Pedobacter terrae TaxID=405671 RepID=A0A1G7XG20_9SPHI|nr:helix-turn-helix domain-containing protein [Pedobacter terrae]SDG82530.1 DNA-binding transcriptional regulator, HxlR family [Pedobacter terrae]
MMYQKKTPTILDCGLHLFMEVMSGKWKISLLWSIYHGIKRPSGIHKTITQASRRVLDAQLNQLVLHGLISRKDYHIKPYKVEYSLTELGHSLIPVIETTARWGEENRLVLEEKIFSCSID